MAPAVVAARRSPHISTAMRGRGLQMRRKRRTLGASKRWKTPVFRGSRGHPAPRLGGRRGQKSGRGRVDGGLARDGIVMRDPR